jgi:putative glutamine amidotransferase
MSPTPSSGVRIAVSQRSEFFASRRASGDFLDFQLQGWLNAVGVFPIPVPNGVRNRIDSWLRAVSPDGFLLSGGEDIGINPDRDTTELAILRYATRLRLPVLGICRGMQILAHTKGVSLKKVDGHAGTEHALLADPSLGFPDRVNSFHNNVVAICPPGYDVIGRHEDGTIEAIRALELPWEGWMWHPERRDEFERGELARARVIFGAVDG